jgi:signal peptidase
MSRPRLLGLVATYAVLGLVTGLLLVSVAPRALGYTPMTVLTGSMRPLIDPGDLVVDERIRPGQARPGDVVSFSDPGRGGQTVTHRVETMETGRGRIDFTTRGDANDTVERWTVPTNGEIGRVVWRVPLIGKAIQPLSTKAGRLLSITIPALLLALLELAGALRPARRSPSGPAPVPAPAID